MGNVSRKESGSLKLSQQTVPTLKEKKKKKKLRKRISRNCEKTTKAIIYA